MATAVDPDFDGELRQAAVEWLKVRTNDGAEFMMTSEIQEFTFRGESFRLMDAQRGIRKPAQLSAALSIRTVYTPEQRDRPYEDQVGPDGLLRYKWRGNVADHPENRALRAAAIGKLPLIWFYGVGTAVYQPIAPVWVVWVEKEQQQFVIDLNITNEWIEQGSVVEQQLRRYIIRETRQRLHQPVFRSTVMGAYKVRCAVCALGHAQLLDAAHIVPDREEQGIASVRNELALCKIHHAAYDSRILRIRPDLVVEIREDLLEEIDGPMLRHGLQGRHNQPLMALPTARVERPARDLLEISYEGFRQATQP